MSETPKRTIIVQPKKAELMAGPGAHYDAEHLMQDALSILSSEIINLKKATAGGTKTLDISQSRVLTGYIKSITDLLKEQRERQSEMDLANMSDNELIQMVEALRAGKKGTSETDPK